MEEDTKQCKACLKILPVYYFYKVNRTYKYTASCKDCFKKRESNFYFKHKDKRLKKQKEYKQTAGSKILSRLSAKRYREKYPDKEASHNECRKALQKGIIKKSNCMHCGSSKSEMHHHLGYAKDNWLNVVWLCRNHHSQAHKQMRMEKL